MIYDGEMINGWLMLVLTYPQGDTMNNINTVLINPWDFTLYKCGNGDYIIKVIFSEGSYKVDVARFFHFYNNEISCTEEINKIKSISEKIRSHYNDYRERELNKKQLEHFSEIYK